ncbi:hypothetical protein COY90_04045 [Candidatus Roizmanbacteria bacterium CG_4_10_14_0_8_um_filter_39_9]|uniref:Uncharacterized protein n=1 Tax=Candidatus Roizmanbacteria bacterium CG_4_10_14_0_8_um_filter_39_9 TaxID=1974829 RepID=A0A2M7QC31_9BACT|nr:MAG: hypothetical protein COY90_04045 [Candidatus Roizmanbacteria bacterium CG_4_10_14_0_8_um_filter_39_9]
MSTFLIVFREFMESLLLMSILLGFSKREGLHKEKSILAGGILGILFSVFITFSVFYVLPLIHISLPSELIDLIGHLAIILSGVMLLYITYRIHPLFAVHKNKHVANLFSQKNIKDASFFVPTFLLVLQEGFEIVLFTMTTSFTHSLASNSLSLVLGFVAAVAASSLLYLTYLKNHVKKLFKITEYTLIIYGAYLIIHGGTELFESLLH